MKNKYTHVFSVVVSTGLVAIIFFNAYSKNLFKTSHYKMKDTQKKRLEDMHKTCRLFKQEDLNHVSFERIIVNDKYKLMYCVIPKVACTNLKRVFAILSDMYNTTNVLEVPVDFVHVGFKKKFNFLSQYNITEIREKIETYQKVIFVRHPFERLLSAYRNKFIDPWSVNFHQSFGRKIIRNYRKGSTHAEIRNGSNVKFTEFVDYVIDPKTSKEGFNEHWQLYNSLCHPCIIKYNFVGKYETLDSDINQVLSSLDLNGIVKFPKRNASYSKEKTVDVMSKFYSKISPKKIKKLLKIYEIDFKMFDYSYPA